MTGNASAITREVEKNSSDHWEKYHGLASKSEEASKFESLEKKLKIRIDQQDAWVFPECVRKNTILKPTNLN